MEHLAAVLVMGFAAYRATQFVVFDSILDPVRARIEAWHADKFTSRPRTLVRDLLSCIFCIGFWLSTATVLVATTVMHQWDRPLLAVAIDCWAVAGVQVLLSRWENSL